MATQSQALKDIDPRVKIDHARRLRAKYRAKAGRAATSPAMVNRELTKEINVFADEDWSNLTVEEIAKVGGKIERLGNRLVAAEAYHEADALVKEIEAEIDALAVSGE